METKIRCRRFIKSSWIGILLGIGLAIQAESAPITVEDAQGESVTIENASRVIAIGGDVAEIVCALGAEKQLVARDDTCGYPEWIAKLPSVGYMRTLTPEGILSLNPSVVFVTQGAGPPATLKLLHDANVPLVHVSQEYTPHAVIQKFQLIAKVLNRKASGEEWIQRLQHWNEILALSLESVQSKPKIVCLMSLQRGTLLAAGMNTSADAMIRLAGGENALQEFTGYKPVSIESIMAAQPDALLIPSHGTSTKDKQSLITAIPELQHVPAIRNDKILIMDSQYLLMFGPRYVFAAADLAAAIHEDYSLPEEFIIDDK